MKKKISVKIVTIQPVQIAVNTGSQNHWDTLDYFPGSTLRGVFSNHYMKQYGMQDDAHLDATFYSLFLSRKLRFLNGNISIDNQRLQRLPLNIEAEKTKDEAYRDGFTTDWNEKTPPAKYKSKWAFPGKGAVSVEKSIFFHTVRKEHRLEGKAGKGGVFTYAAIEKNQEFIAEIIAEEEDLKLFKETMTSSFKAWIGRSKTAQYGEVEIKLGDIEDLNETIKEADTLNMVFTSDALFRDENGFPQISIPEVLTIISRQADIKTPSIATQKNMTKQVKMKSRESELYFRHWDMKRPSSSVITASSVIGISLAPEDGKKLMQYALENGLGEQRTEGFGEVSFIQYNESDLSRLKKERIAKEPSRMDHGTKDILNEAMDIAIKKLIKASAQDAILMSESQLPNSLGSRLLSILKVSDSGKKFQESTVSLTVNLDTNNKFKTHKKSGLTLKKIRVDNMSLLDHFNNAVSASLPVFISEKTIVREFIQNTSKLREKIGLSFDNNDFVFKAYKVYLEAVLIRIRKMNRGSNKGEKNDK